MKIGIDLGGSHIAIGLVNKENKIIEKRFYYMNDRKEEDSESYIINSIIKGINDILKSCEYNLNQIEMIGIAMPGNPKNGCIKNVVNLGIEEFNIISKLQEKLKNNSIKIMLENDGKCAALAEKRGGALKEFKDCIFLCIGTGIGGAVFIDNKLVKSKKNSCFEFGHMIISKDGEKCKCGNKGCFEVYCSKKKFKEKMKEVLGIKEYINASDLTKIINKNIENKKVSELLDEYIENILVGLANIINIFEPEAICIGGSLSHYESLIINKVRDRLEKGEYLFNKENPPKIVIAKLENEAGIIGATLIDME